MKKNASAAANGDKPKDSKKKKKAAKVAEREKTRVARKAGRQAAAAAGSGDDDEDGDEDEIDDEYDDEYGDYGDEEPEGNPGEIVVTSAEEIQKMKGALTLVKPTENQYTEADILLG